MSRNTSLCFAALTVFVVATSLVVEKADAATFIVGDTMGWRVPSGADAYATWASRHTFSVGDTLVFNFHRDHLMPVTKEAFDACNSSAIIQLLTIGPANVTLTTPGKEYFICTFGQHCVAGQKLAVNVTGSSISPSPPPTPTITPSPSTTPPSTTPPPSSTAAPPPVPETPPPSSTPPSPSMSPSGRPAIPPSSSMSPSGRPPMPPSSSISPSGGPAMPPSSNVV
ncbi:hypothetical protein Leryth_001346 [Lithospermum erythrorhizon]|nr:hypothetical protein Leryth_001346 [Lithospermum erythrorhizon]